MIEAYHPDFIFIFNWEERDDVFEGMDLSGRKCITRTATGCIYLARLLYQGDMDFPSPALFLFRTNIEEMAGSLADTFAAIR